MPRLMRSCRLSWIALVLSTLPAAAQNQHDMTFHTVPPCTVVDTRVTGGAFAVGETRTYNAVGNGSFASQGGSVTGCGIPGFSNGIAQVQAIAMVFTAVNPSGQGYVAANAADQAMAGAVLATQAASPSTNTSPVAVAQTSGVGDFKVLVAYTTSHVVVRVVGYYSKPVQTVHVHPVPGDNTASGTALLNTMSGITNASATKRYVIKLEPGIYDVGSTELVMKPYMDIEGSGQEATVIQGSRSVDPYTGGVVRGAASAEIRDLQINSIGSVPIAFFSPANTDTRLRNVTLVASGGDSSWGIRAVGGSPLVEECTIRAQGGGSSYGFVSRGETSRPAIKRTVIEVTSGSYEGRGMALLDGSASAEIRDVQIKVSGSSSASYGIYIDEITHQQSFRITSSTIDVGGASSNTGIWFGGLQLNVEQSQVRATGSNSTGILQYVSGTAVIDHSEIAGETHTVNGNSVFIGATQLNGGPVSAGAICAGVYDESFTFFAGPACP